MPDRRCDCAPRTPCGGAMGSSRPTIAAFLSKSTLPGGEDGRHIRPTAICDIRQFLLPDCPQLLLFPSSTPRIIPKRRASFQARRGGKYGRHVIGIRANGDVLPCLSLGGQFVEDNLRRRPLVDIWRDPNSFPRFRNKSASLGERAGGNAAPVCIE